MFGFEKVWRDPETGEQVRLRDIPEFGKKGSRHSGYSPEQAKREMKNNKEDWKKCKGKRTPDAATQRALTKVSKNKPLSKKEVDLLAKWATVKNKK